MAHAPLRKGESALEAQVTVRAQALGPVEMEMATGACWEVSFLRTAHDPANQIAAARTAKEA